MKRFLKVIGSLILILLVVGAIAWFGFLKPEPPPISDQDRAKITLMPLPQELKLTGKSFVITNQVGLNLPDEVSSDLESAAQRFIENLSSKTQVKLGNDGKGIDILIAQPGPVELSESTDESYSITIESSKITINAHTESGAIYAFESLFQLATKEQEQWVWPTMELKDQPRYPWRGLMIDAGRHFITKANILRQLDAMAAVKMNVLHFHLTEYQGFRIESKVFPKLHEMGSEGQYYSQEDMKEIIAYAKERNIRVVPEFDLPGHSTSWLVGYPELATNPGPYQLDTVFGILDPVMDPTKEEVYTFLDQFIEEMAAIFPDEYMHIGGDEVKTAHWENSPTVQAFMEANQIKDFHELQAHFNIRAQKILAKHGKKMMGWDEIIHPDLPKDGIAVQSWRSQSSLWEAARNGNKSILSAGYYLDHKKSAADHYKVDPLIIPGAITIDVDSTNWRGYHCKMYIQDMEMDAEIYLFGNDDNLKGIVKSDQGSTDFQNVTAVDGKMNFTIDSQYGKLKYDVAMVGDSLVGNISIMMFEMALKGVKAGGSDMTDGEPLPHFEKINQLLPEEELNILGGEACMWSEMVNDTTIESRVWPRAAAIAEKLWSPQVLTSDANDMYRRLNSFNTILINKGLKHESYRKEILNTMVDPSKINSLLVFTNLLQEDIYFNRMSIYKPALTTKEPLNRMVDAAAAESYVALEFNQMVDAYVELPSNETKEALMQQLQQWQGLEAELKEAINLDSRLQDVSQHLNHLTMLSGLSIKKLNGENLEIEPNNLKELLANSHKSYGATLLPVSKGLEKLLNN